MDQEFLMIFLEEGKEHLQSLNTNVLELEKNMNDTTIINEIFRSAHTFKGMSSTMGFVNIANLTHEMENVLDKIRTKKLSVNEKIVDVIFRCIDDLERMTLDVENGGQGDLDVSETIAILNEIDKSGNATKEELDKKEEAVELFAFDNFEIELLNEMKDTNKNVYEIEVFLHRDCILKSARVFMVFNVLESLGEVIKTLPPIEKLEIEEFELNFKMVFVSEEKEDNIKNRILDVSEVENVELKIFDISTINEEKEDILETEGLSEEKVSLVEKEPKKEENSNVDVTNKKSVVKNDQMIRVNLSKIDNLMNMFEELVIEKGHIEQISKETKNKELLEKVEKMSIISKNLQSIILNMRMVSVEQVFNRFPRMVRNLSKELEKEIELIIIGEDTEIDRTVIDEIGDPLVHLIRNSIDHGIESKEKREAANKKRKGTIKLEAYHSGNNVIISVSDDGDGIDKDRIIKKALDKDLITEDKLETMTEQQVYDLIFHSGFSTAEVVSDVSGRGVGLDVVKTTIQKLGGRIIVKSEKGKGTSFVIQLPLTLSIIQCMLVKMDKETFGIPIANINETMVVDKSAIDNVQGKQVLNYRKKIIPLIFLKETFKFGKVDRNKKDYRVVVIANHEQMYAVVVDEFIGQQEIVLKTLGDYFSYHKENKLLSGATILGNGQVALILDCERLLN